MAVIDELRAQWSAQTKHSADVPRPEGRVIPLPIELGWDPTWGTPLEMREPVYFQEGHARTAQHSC
jgi:hypothetical protein